MTASGEAAAPWPAPWLHRLRLRLGSLRGPVVQVWGPPGSGKGLLLQALSGSEGLEVSPAVLTDPAALAAAADSARGQGLAYLLCRRWPGEGLRRGLPFLSSRPLVVFTGRLLEPPDPESDEVLGPGDLALTLRETAALWQAVVGEGLDEESTLLLRQATGGWLRPLELTAQAVLQGGSPAFRAGDLAALPSVQSFLEGEVLAPLTPQERDALLGLGGCGAAREVASGLRRTHGLLFLDRGGRARPLRLLEALGKLQKAAAEPTPTTFHVQFFGPPQAWREEGERRQVVASPLRRTLKIFAYLLGQPDRRATRLGLVEAAFVDEGLEAVRRNFHPTLSTLRRALSAGAAQPLEVLLFREGFYELSSAHGWQVDTDRFLALSQSAQAHRQAGRSAAAVEHWQEAWKLYRGPYLEGYEEGWVIQRREALYRGYLALLRDLADALSELGRLPEALDAYRALLIEDPLQEAVQVLVMSLYAAQGRRDLVRRQFDRLSKLLNEELGVEPLQATTLAYHRLMG